MKLSIVVICWNDLKVLKDCLKSIFEGTQRTELEVVVSDNGSTDGSPAWIREHYPHVRIVENGANLGFARGNNAGIAAATGDYVLILNPDTIIHGDSLDRWMDFVQRHPEAGAFGCRVLNKDGTYQHPARPFPTPRRYWAAALGLRGLGRLSDRFAADKYVGWAGETERAIDWQSGCCVMVRGDILKRIEGFDPRFFYHFEEVDLCYRVWQTGSPILHTPDAEITHLGGQSVGRFPIRFELEKYRNRYRYFYKHYGEKGARQCRRAALAWLKTRRAFYKAKQLVKGSDEALKNRLEMYRVVIGWHEAIDPVEFARTGREPDAGYEPLAPAVPLPAAASGSRGTLNGKVA